MSIEGQIEQIVAGCEHRGYCYVSDEQRMQLKRLVTEVEADIICLNTDRGGCPDSYVELQCRTCKARSYKKMVSR